MADKNIYRDSQIVDVLVAQANGERVDSKVQEDAEAIYAELYSDMNPMNKYMLANLVSFAVERQLPKATDWRNYIADVKRVGEGDDAAFRVRIPGIKAFIQPKGATTPRSRVANKQFVPDIVAVSARPVVSLHDLRSGRIKMADLVNEATFEMANAENKYVEGVLLSAATNWGTPFYGTGSGIVAATFDPMVQHWLRTGSAAIVGDIAPIQKLAQLTGFASSASTQQFSDDVINEFNKTGRVGSYKGAAVVQFANPYGTDEVTPAMDIGALYIIPTAARPEDRVLKIVEKGGILNIDNTDIDEVTYEIRMDQLFGAGIAMGAHPMMSVYEDGTL